MAKLWGERWRWDWRRGWVGLALAAGLLAANVWRGDLGVGLALAGALSGVGWVRRGRSAG